MTTQDALSPSLQPPYSLTLPGPVWGLDPSTLRLSAGVVEPGVPGTDVADNAVHWATCSYSQAGTMETRLARALGDLLRFFSRQRDAYGGPHAIFLEEPFGGSDKPGKGGRIIKPHPHAFYFVAVVRCALGHLFTDVPVEMIGPPSWKKLALGTGHGFADKPEIMRWARSIGYTGVLEDEADAIAIATAGAVKQSVNPEEAP